jgi:hypothetical protein
MLYRLSYPVLLIQIIAEKYNQQITPFCWKQKSNPEVLSVSVVLR